MTDSKRQSFPEKLGESRKSGQGTVEYVLLILGVTVAAGLVSRTLITGLDTSVGFLGAELERSLKTGRMKSSVWAAD